MCLQQLVEVHCFPLLQLAEVACFIVAAALSSSLQEEDAASPFSLSLLAACQRYRHPSPSLSLFPHAVPLVQWGQISAAVVPTKSKKPFVILLLVPGQSKVGGMLQDSISSYE